MIDPTRPPGRRSTRGSTRTPASRLRFTLLNVGGWVLFSAVVSVWLEAQRRGLGVPAPYGTLFRHTLVFWILWTIPTVFIFRAFRRFPWEPGRTRRTLALHLAASLLWMPIYGALLVPVATLVFGVPWSRFPEFAPRFYGTLFWIEYLLYWPVFAVAAAHDGLRRARDREALARELTQARLDALRSQIQPHFLFNTLAAISGLLRSGETALSARSIESLADLLRRVVSQSDRPLVPFAEELATAELYLEIQKIRCGNRLSVEIATDPRSLALGVPNLLLQPLLENAFEHGVARVPGRVRVAVRTVLREEGTLSIEIENPIPADAAPPSDTGLGIANTRSRLELLFPGQARLDLALDRTARLARTSVLLPERPLP